MAQIVKILSAVQETWVLSLVWEDPLEKEMAPHSSILAWRIAWMEEPGELQSMGLQRVGCNDWVNNTYVSRIDAFELWCWRRLLRVPLDCKEIHPVHSKGDRPWVLFGRNDAKAETPVLWPPHAKSWLIGKDSDAGRDWGQKEKGTTEDEMAGWHHRLDGREFEWTPGVGDGQGGLACCDSWDRKESDTTEQLNWTELAWNVPLVSLIFLKWSRVFPILLFSSICLHWSLRKAFLSLLALL